MPAYYFYTVKLKIQYPEKRPGPITTENLSLVIHYPGKTKKPLNLKSLQTPLNRGFSFAPHFFSGSDAKNAFSVVRNICLMPFVCIAAYAALLLHHQLNPISQKKTKRLNIQIQRKNQTLPKNQKVIEPRTPRGFFYVHKHKVIPAEKLFNYL